MAPSSTWPWFTLAGLGAFHGLNPAMGWLFAVALGLHRRSRWALFAALPPMAAGHVLSIGLTAASVMALGTFVVRADLRLVAGGLLILWAGYHWLYGHRHRVRVGLTAGLAGLAFWSFLMASAHGAGLMLVPALLPLCVDARLSGSGSLLSALAAVGVHTAATLAVTGLVALVVYDRLGLAILRQSWINFDRLWSGMLVATGVMLMATA